MEAHTGCRLLQHFKKCFIKMNAFPLLYTVHLEKRIIHVLRTLINCLPLTVNGNKGWISFEEMEMYYKIQLIFNSLWKWQSLILVAKGRRKTQSTYSRDGITLKCDEPWFVRTEKVWNYTQMLIKINAITALAPCHGRTFPPPPPQRHKSNKKRFLLPVSLSTHRGRVSASEEFLAN